MVLVPCILSLVFVLRFILYLYILYIYSLRCDFDLFVVFYFSRVRGKVDRFPYTNCVTIATVSGERDERIMLISVRDRNRSVVACAHGNTWFQLRRRYYTCLFYFGDIIYARRRRVYNTCPLNISYIMCVRTCKGGYLKQ